MKWEVKFFQTARKHYPVKEFIEKQEKTTLAKILRSIELLENYGPYLKPPYIKKIDRNLYELRIIGKESVRIFYTSFGNRYYLLHAFKKKSQKTPRQEIHISLDRMKEII